MYRLLSYSEVSKALDCQAAWDFRYGGHLAGDALQPKAVAPHLSAGRAWGAAMAAWHSRAFTLDAIEHARNALWDSLQADLQEQVIHGFGDEAQMVEIQDLLLRLLDHYAKTADPLPLEAIEHELEVPIPSRSGKGRGSTRYRLRCFLDGVHYDGEGRPWVVEFKLRKQLSSLEQVELSRQIRWYAWAWGKTTGKWPIGVIVDERWKMPPQPPRLVQGRAKADPEHVPSHAVDQVVDPDDYVAMCAEYGVLVNAATLKAMQSRTWQLRHPIMFRPGELEQAAQELTSAAKLLNQLDSGLLTPIRNPKPYHCRGCEYAPICPHPEERGPVDLLFDRVPAKRDREQEPIR